MAKKYKRKRKKNFTEEQVLEILEERLEAYIEGFRIAYIPAILREGLSSQHLNYWKGVSEDVKAIMTEFEEIQDYKLEETLLGDQGANYNATGLIWFSKSRKKWIDYAVELKIESDENIAENMQVHEIVYVDGDE